MRMEGMAVKKMLRLAVCMLVVFTVVVGMAVTPVYAGQPLREGESDVSTISISDEPVPTAMPGTAVTASWAVSSLLLALAALGLGIWAARLLKSNRQQVAFKGMAVLFGAATLVLFFLTNNLGGAVQLVNANTLPLGLLLLVQGALLLMAHRRRLAEEEEWH